MNKYFFGLFAVVGILLAASVSQASVVARMPKTSYTSTFTTSAVFVSSGPAAIYQVIQSTGASGEYFMLCDSNTVTGITAVSNGNLGANSPCKVHLLFGSTTANTVTTFDPPIMFYNGIVIIDSANTGQATFTYEPGRGLSGQ